jgi:hypothetical protein
MARARVEREASRGYEHGEAAARKGMELLVSNQMMLFNQLNEMSKRWLDRRREDIDATRQSLDEIGECESWSEMLRIQQQWMLGSLRRMANDFSELASGALSLSRQAASRLESTTEAISEDLEHAGRDTVSTLSAAGSKPRPEMSE